MTQGVSIATKKDGTVYYRAGLYYKNKHISLGSYADETTAGNAYLEALAILGSLDQTPEDYVEQESTLSFEKIIVLLNFRNNGIYFKNPIYLRNGYFSYYLSRTEELKFDVDDLFYYSGRKIQKRQGHLFVSDYGMQYSILSRYGIRPYAPLLSSCRIPDGGMHTADTAAAFPAKRRSTRPPPAIPSVRRVFPDKIPPSRNLPASWRSSA